MTEIPLPPSDGYIEPAAPSKGRGCGTTLIVGLIIAIVVIGGIIVVMLPSFGNGGNGVSYDERVIDEFNNSDLILSPTYYYNEFYVSSSEVQTATQPDLLFEIEFDHTGDDSVTVSVYCAVYDVDEVTVESAATWDELNPYLVDDFQYDEPINDWIDLHNYAETYTWVIWFEADGSKTSTWSVDITLTLRYNW